MRRSGACLLFAGIALFWGCGDGDSAVCPDSQRSALGYTAAGDELSLFEENEEVRFQRR